MTKRATQQDYWNSRANVWGSYDVPLIPSPEDVEFQRKQLVSDGDTLVLGATRELCSIAKGVSRSVTAVDFSGPVIEALRTDGVEYEQQEWLTYLEQSTEKFDNIMTDGGLLCLDFPASWQRIAKQIYDHLKPGGIFTARVYISTDKPPKEQYDNPNLGRFITSMTHLDDNWTLRPQHPDYAAYDVRYALPPEKEVLRTFGKLALIETRVPDYEAGEYFPTYAWQRS